MSRAVAFVSLLVAFSLGAQEPPPALGLPPPEVPGSSAPVIPMAPPLPGQLQGLPALPSLPSASGTDINPGGDSTGSDAKASLSVPLIRPKAGSSTSTTGQFIVHGDDFTLRSALSSKCEDIAGELRTLLHDKQSWVLPIVVLLNSGETARKADKTVSTAISQLTHGGFHLQVNVNMRPDLSPMDLRKEVIRVLLAERILRDQKEITTQRKMLLPDWLFLGILEAIDYRQRARPSTLFAAIFKSGKIFGIEEIIEASASDIDDALSKTIYQTSCCALVLALLDQPDSGLRMGKFLNALATDPRSERELLNQWFPNFASSEASLNKWWALQLATLASPSMSEPLSPQDTLEALEEALILRFQAKPSELPQNSRRVASVVKASPPKPRPLVVSEPRNVSEAPPLPEEPTEESVSKDPEKTGFISRLNPFSRRKTSDDEINAAIEEAMRVEAESTTPASDMPAEPEVSASPEPEVSGSTGRKPLLGRLFGEDEKPKDTPEIEEKPKLKSSNSTAAASKPEKKPEPKTEAPADKPSEESEADKKPSSLNPMNWFRGGKKEKDEKDPAEEAPKEEKSKKAALSPEPDSIAAQLRANRPIVAFVFQEVAAEVEEEPATQKKRFFGLLGKKKPEGDPAEPEAPKKAEEQPTEDPKETPKEQAPKAKRQPLRLNLFGNDKKEEESKVEEEPQAEMPPESPPAPESEAPSKPKPRPAPVKSQESKDDSPIAAAIPIEDYAAILKRKDLTEILSRNANSLAVLQNRGSILFRPVVNDYINALEDILKGRTKGLDDRLRVLRVRTQEALEKSHAVRDLLDLHEANDSPAMSGLFEDYLKLPETIQNELPPRTDPISKYLDALDKEFSKD